MSLYESNYLRFLHLAGDPTRLSGTLVSRIEGDCELRLAVLEHMPYTSMLALTYILPSGDSGGLERLPDLMTLGMERRVVLVTPTTLFGLCKVVAYGWRAETQARNAAEVAALGRELYNRLAVMGGHATAMGRSLGQAVERYNQFVGSLESQVLSQARRFEDLQVDHEGREIAELTPIETAVRPLGKLAPALTLVEPAPTSAS